MTLSLLSREGENTFRLSQALASFPPPPRRRRARPSPWVLLLLSCGTCFAVAEASSPSSSSPPSCRIESSNGRTRKNLAAANGGAPLRSLSPPSGGRKPPEGDGDGASFGAERDSRGRILRRRRPRRRKRLPPSYDRFDPGEEGGGSSSLEDAFDYRRGRRDAPMRRRGGGLAEKGGIDGRESLRSVPGTNLWRAARRWIDRVALLPLSRRRVTTDGSSTDRTDFEPRATGKADLEDLDLTDDDGDDDGNDDDDKSDEKDDGGWNRRALREWIDAVEIKFVSAETSRALKTIRKITARFSDFGVVDVFAAHPPRDIMLSMVAYSRLQRADNLYVEQKEKEDEEKAATTIEIDQDLLDDLTHYSVFAHAAYGWKGGLAFFGRLHFGNNRALVQRTGIEHRDIVSARWHSKANRPAYFLARDTERKAIVLGIRGTLSPRDVITDLCASSQNFIVEDNADEMIFERRRREGNPIVSGIGDLAFNASVAIHAVQQSPPTVQMGRAHKGMIDGAKAVARVTGKLIAHELEKNPEYDLVIVGHSLGAGVGAVLASMWMRRFPNRVRSFCYGSPCVFSSGSGLVDGVNADDPSGKDDKIVSVVAEGDPFSRMSLGHLADATAVISRLCLDGGFRDEILNRTEGNLEDLSPDDLSWCHNTMSVLKKHMTAEKLYPPGIIYLMGRSVTKRVDSSVFQYLKLHSRMFDLSLHVPIRYENLLRRLSSEKRRAAPDA